VSGFLNMGGYAEFVWTCYGLAAVTLVFNVLSARKRLRMTQERMVMRAARRNRGKESARSAEL
jgi:heme exporter protein CcmD